MLKFTIRWKGRIQCATLLWPRPLGRSTRSPCQCPCAGKPYAYLCARRVKADIAAPLARCGAIAGSVPSHPTGGHLAGHEFFGESRAIVTRADTGLSATSAHYANLPDSEATSFGTARPPLLGVSESAYVSEALRDGLRMRQARLRASRIRQ